MASSFLSRDFGTCTFYYEQLPNGIFPKRTITIILLGYPFVATLFSCNCNCIQILWVQKQLLNFGILSQYWYWIWQNEIHCHTNASVRSQFFTSSVFAFTPSSFQTRVKSNSFSRWAAFSATLAENNAALLSLRSCMQRHSSSCLPPSSSRLKSKEARPPLSKPFFPFGTATFSCCPSPASQSAHSKGAVICEEVLSTTGCGTESSSPSYLSTSEITLDKSPAEEYSFYHTVGASTFFSFASSSWFLFHVSPIMAAIQYDSGR